MLSYTWYTRSKTRLVYSQGGRLAHEIQLLRLLNHPNVIRLHEVLHTPSEILMVMEYVDGGDLLEVLNTQPRFKEEQAAARAATRTSHRLPYAESHQEPSLPHVRHSRR